MKTFYVLWIMMCSLALMCVGASSLPWLGKIALCFLILILGWREIVRFRIKSISFQNDKILINYRAKTIAAVFKPTSVVTRYLCFLHVKALDDTKSWYLPVSRLEFSRESFRCLKSSVQRFLMDKN